MSVELESAARLAALKSGIEAKTGETYTDLTGGVNALIAGFGQGGGSDTSNEDGLVTRTLTEYRNDRITTIGTHAFISNSTIEKVSFPNVTTFMGSNQFNGCTALKEIYFPKLENANGGNAFSRCTSLIEAVFPAYSPSVGAPSFIGCTSLIKLDYGSLYSFGGVSGATSLKTIILRRSDRVATLNRVTEFDNTPFASGGTGGTVYVPAALIDSYKTATNWVTLYEAGTCNFVAIEGSEYE